MYAFPKVSCCLCTYDRLELTKKSIICFTKQTYPNKELVIVTEGPEEFKRELELFIGKLGRNDIKTVFIDGARTLGEVRNISIANSIGDLYCQWDDDDFNHPKRLSVQIAYMISQKADACFLKDQLHYYWADNELFWEKWNYENAPERCQWIPGTIIMKMNKLFSYPETGANAKAGEDVILVDQIWHEYIMNGYQVATLENKGYLHVYSYHGSICNHKNTFDSDHHRWLSKNRSLNIADIQDRKNEIIKSLNELDLNDEIKVMGKNGLAFMYQRAR